jgi:hypothetical protein
MLAAEARQLGLHLRKAGRFSGMVRHTPAAIYRSAVSSVLKQLKASIYICPMQCLPSFPVPNQLVKRSDLAGYGLVNEVCMSDGVSATRRLCAIIKTDTK